MQIGTTMIDFSDRSQSSITVFDSNSGSGVAIGIDLFGRGLMAIAGKS
jgi:hypothetical protein